MSKLFTPVQIGAVALGHRIVMAPLTRSRSTQPGDVLVTSCAPTTANAPPRAG